MLFYNDILIKMIIIDSKHEDLVDKILEKISENTYLDFRLEQVENGDFIIQFVNEPKLDHNSI